MAAATAYDQQRAHHHTRDLNTDRLISHTEQVCPAIIPTGHTKESAQDDSLHKVFLSSNKFRGKDHAGLH